MALLRNSPCWVFICLLLFTWIVWSPSVILSVIHNINMWSACFLLVFWFLASWGQGADTTWPHHGPWPCEKQLASRGTHVPACLGVGFLLMFFHFMVYLCKTWFRETCVAQSHVYALMWCSENWKCAGKGDFLSYPQGPSVASSVLPVKCHVWCLPKENMMEGALILA